jgi:ubiquinone/menaquinone biosynthesis C-methylase UbiE
MTIFQYLSDNPAIGAIFNSSMSGFQLLDTTRFLNAYDLSEVNVLADIGGGNGSLVIAALERHPNLRGIVFDLPDVIVHANTNLEAQGFQNRCQLVAGDFTADAIPQADCILLRNVLHNWPDSYVEAILKKCCESLPANGRVVIAENLIPSDDRPHFGKLLDLAMLVIPGGRERDESQFATLFASAGLRLNRIVPTAGELCAVEAVHAGC